MHNKTANTKNIVLSNLNSKDINYTNSFKNKTIESEIQYKNILEKLENSNKREKHLNNQIILLEKKLNEKNNLEKTFPNDINNIPSHLHDSCFLDDDEAYAGSVEYKNAALNHPDNNNNEDIKKDINDKDNDINNDELNKSIEIASKEDPFKESERKVDEFLMNGAGDPDDYDEVKVIVKQMNFLKEEIKENTEKNKNLSKEIKELFSTIKCNDKNRKNIVQICQLLNFPPQVVEQIIMNKKGKK